MASLIEVKIPNLGEAEDTEIIEISVKVGDSVLKNEPLIVLESEKAAMEVPSDYKGKIKEIKVKEGDSVSEGTVFATLEINEEITEAIVKDTVAKDEEQIQLVENKQMDLDEQVLSFEGINAGPAVRKIARELSINLSDILGTGKNKMVTKDDLKNYIASLKDKISTRFADISTLEEFGEYQLINQTKIRTKGAENLHESWTSIPHVTHFEEADITHLEHQRADLNKISAQKITPLSFVVKAVSIALEKYPLFNSSLVGKGKIMKRNYINLGIAVNTNDGLIVPVIKNANNLNVGQIAYEIKTLSDKAKNNKLFTKDLKGATFTISSLGSIGGTGFTPIINPPEVGIMGLSKTKTQLSLVKDNIEEKTILPFSVSYDHRVINGVDAGNFVDFVKDTLEKGIT